MFYSLTYLTILGFCKPLPAEPINTPERSSRGMELSNQGRFEEATALFRETLEDNPSRPALWEHYGTGLAMLGTHIRNLYSCILMLSIFSFVYFFFSVR